VTLARGMSSLRILELLAVNIIFDETLHLDTRHT
jgi:hypothetical protein